MFGNNFSLSLTMQSSRCTRAPGKPASIKMVSLTHSVSSSSLGFSRRVVAVDMVWQVFDNVHWHHWSLLQVHHSRPSHIIVKQDFI